MKINYNLEKVDPSCQHLTKTSEGIIYRKIECRGYRCANMGKCDLYLKEYNKAKREYLIEHSKIESVKYQQKNVIYLYPPITTEIPKIEEPKEEPITLEQHIKNVEIADIEYRKLEKKNKSLVTKKLIKFIVKNNLCTEDAELVYQQVKRISITKPHEIEIKYFTNSKGVEERVRGLLEKLESEGKKVEIVKLAKKKWDFTPKIVKPVNTHRKELMDKIRTGNIEVITIE